MHTQSSGPKLPVVKPSFPWQSLPTDLQVHILNLIIQNLSSSFKRTTRKYFERSCGHKPTHPRDLKRLDRFRENLLELTVIMPTLRTDIRKLWNKSMATFVRELNGTAYSSRLNIRCPTNAGSHVVLTTRARNIGPCLS